jgi:hypothetical protein
MVPHCSMTGDSRKCSTKWPVGRLQSRTSGQAWPARVYWRPAAFAGASSPVRQGDAARIAPSLPDAIHSARRSAPERRDCHALPILRPLARRWPTRPLPELRPAHTSRASRAARRCARTTGGVRIRCAPDKRFGTGRADERAGGGQLPSRSGARGRHEHLDGGRRRAGRSGRGARREHGERRRGICRASCAAPAGRDAAEHRGWDGWHARDARGSRCHAFCVRAACRSAACCRASARGATRAGECAGTGPFRG